MNKIKIGIAILIVIIMSLSLCGCTVLYGELFVKTKDANGKDDTSLVTYTDEDVCSPELEGYGFLYGFDADGDPSIVDEELLWDGDLTTATASSPYSGCATLQLTGGKTDVIRFTVTPTLTDGNLRIVLLDQDYNILYDFATDQESSYEVTAAKEKRFEIRAVGESAQFEIKTKREFRW